MKTLTFDNKELYENLYEAFSASDTGHQGATRVRSIGKIYLALDSIGTVRPDDLGKAGLMTLKEVPATVELEDADFNVLRDSVENTRWRNAMTARTAVAIFDWLDAVK